jgi:hypothetical protein
MATRGCGLSQEGTHPLQDCRWLPARDGENAPLGIRHLQHRVALTEFKCHRPPPLSLVQDAALECSGPEVPSSSATHAVPFHTRTSSTFRKFALAWFAQNEATCAAAACPNREMMVFRWSITSTATNRGRAVLGRLSDQCFDTAKRATLLLRGCAGGRLDPVLRSVWLDVRVRGPGSFPDGGWEVGDQVLGLSPPASRLFPDADQAV